MKTLGVFITCIALLGARTADAGNIYIYAATEGGTIEATVTNASLLRLSTVDLAGDVNLQPSHFAWNAGTATLSVHTSLVAGAAGGDDWLAEKDGVVAGAAGGDDWLAKSNTVRSGAAGGDDWLTNKAAVEAGASGGDDWLAAKSDVTAGAAGGDDWLAAKSDVTAGAAGGDDWLLQKTDVVAGAAGGDDWLAAKSDVTAGAAGGANWLSESGSVVRTSRKITINGSTKDLGSDPVFAISEVGNIYTIDGSIHEPREVDVGSYNLTFTSTGGVVGIDAPFRASGAQYVKPPRVVSSLSEFAWQDSDYIVIVTGGGAGQTVALPAPETGRKLIIRNSTSVSGSAATIAWAPTAPIGGPTTIVSTGFQTIVSDGTNWYTVQSR